MTENNDIVYIETNVIITIFYFINLIKLKTNMKLTIL